MIHAHTLDLDITTSLPPLLPLAKQIEDTMEDPESSFEDIARLIESHPRTSEGLLKLANSKFFNYPIPVTNVPEALSVIGLRNARNFSIALSLPETLSTSKSFPVPNELFWRHSIAVGLCTRLLALESRDANTERHFLAGFLHLISRPLLARIYPQQSLDLYRRVQAEETYYNALVQKRLGIDELELGALALQHWGFSANITTLVRHHSKPVLARHHVRGVSFVHLSSFIVTALGIGNSGDRFVPEFSEAAWGFSAFEESKLSLVVDELLRQIDSVCDVFLP